MKHTQEALLIIQLSALGQMDISAADRETLRTLEFLLEQALKKCARGARRCFVMRPHAARWH
jgi:hypothetical protein